MATHKGKPSGKIKPEKRGTGIPSDFKSSDIRRNEKLTDKYIDDGRLGESVRSKHPNRNTKKTNATNAGGYKN